jgi:hypothetical protein
MERRLILQLRTERQRMLFLAISAAVVVGVLVSMDPVAQDPAYHHFADEISLMGIPNWQNVLSNIPFAIVGLLGIARILGVFLTAFGSGYYHWRPDNFGLFWDRLPMTVGFSGLFAAIIGERVSDRAYRYSLGPLVMLGVASAVYWIISEQSGAGDLRPYAFVQFYPLAAIPCLVGFCPPRYTHGRYIGFATGCYVLAKVCEELDKAIWNVTGQVVSGHALKHVLAALGCYLLLRMIKIRQPV